MENEAWTFTVLLVSIIGVGISLALLFQNTARGFRTDMNRLEDRVTSLDNSLRDRIAWIEGLLGAFTKNPDAESVYRWRAIDKPERNAGD